MKGRKILGVIRLILLAIVTFPFFTGAFIFRPDLRKDKLAGARYIGKWSRALMALLGFRIQVEGKPPEGNPYLLICNHRSSLDPLVIMSRVPGYPVAKADVSGYPMVGPGAKRVGVIFVEKTNRSSREATKQAIYKAFQEGKSILIFPEGRTHAEQNTVTFQKGAFDQAAALGIPVVPIALDYKYTSDYWDHKETMVQHYFANLAKWRTPVRIRFGTPIKSDNSFTLLRQSQAWIDEVISEFREGW